MTNIQSSTVIDNIDNTTSNVINIHAQSNLDKESEYRDVGRQLTKIIYKKNNSNNSNNSNNFNSVLNGKMVKVYLPKIEKNNDHNIIITLRRYIIDIALQAKVHGIQIQLFQL